MSRKLLEGRRVLVVEDNYLLATDLADFLRSCGAAIVGPVGTVSRALAMVRREPVDAAVLDVNLHDEQVYPVADALIERGVPLVFCTGYEQLLMGPPYIALPRCQKPVDKSALATLLARLLAA